LKIQKSVYCTPPSPTVYLGAKLTKTPVAMGLVTNRRLFRKLYHQTMPAGT